MSRSPASQFRVRDGVSVRPRLPVEIGRPVIDQPPPTLEEITARGGRRGGVLYRMGERGIDHFAACARSFRGPVPEARPESMRHGGDGEFFDELAQRCVGERLPTGIGEDQAGAIARSLYVVQARKRPPRKWDTVIPLRVALMRPAGMVQTPTSRSISSGRRQAGFAGSRRRQDQELERPRRSVAAAAVRSPPCRARSGSGPPARRPWSPRTRPMRGDAWARRLRGQACPYLGPH